jgi:hypothetical protein
MLGRCFETTKTFAEAAKVAKKRVDACYRAGGGTLPIIVAQVSRKYEEEQESLSDLIGKNFYDGLHLVRLWCNAPWFIQTEAAEHRVEKVAEDWSGVTLTDAENGEKGTYKWEQGPLEYMSGPRKGTRSWPE